MTNETDLPADITKRIAELGALMTEYVEGFVVRNRTALLRIVRGAFA